jgi:hypothetical protein
LATDDNFPHLAAAEGGSARIEDRPPLIRHFDTEALKPRKIHAHSAFASYRGTLLPERRRLVEHYELVDLALKVVGVGSVGTFCAIGLFMTDTETGRNFYVRQLKYRRLGSIGEGREEGALDAYASLCGRTLARAHARTGDPAALAGYMGKSEAIDDALASFAMTYAAQTKEDHARLKAAHRDKTRLAAE